MSTSQNALYSICLGLEGFWYYRKRTAIEFLHSLGQLRPSCATRVHAGSESLIVGRDYAVSSYTSAQTGLRPDAEIHCVLVRPRRARVVEGVNRRIDASVRWNS